MDARDVTGAILLHPVMYPEIHKGRTLCLIGSCHQIIGDPQDCKEPTVFLKNPDR